MATIAIGDIHGCLTALRTLLEALELTSADTLIYLGDYVDKGPDTNGVIEHLLHFETSAEQIYLQGNHELLMLAARSQEDMWHNWLRYGGRDTLASYGLKATEADWAQRIPSHHWEFISAGAKYHQLGQTVFVHAGLHPHKVLEDQTEADLKWEKYVVPAPHDSGYKVISGHTARKNGEIADFGHTICLDTYAYGGQWLTALELESGRYVQADEQGRIRRGRL